MKKVTLITKDVAEAYKMIGRANYQKLSDDDKIRLWRIARKLRKTAEDYDRDLQDAQQKFEPDGNFRKNMFLARNYEAEVSKGQTDNLSMSEKDYREFIMRFQEYDNLIGKAIKEVSEHPVEIEFEPLTEDAFEKLLLCNEWPLHHVRYIDWMF